MVRLDAGRVADAAMSSESTSRPLAEVAAAGTRAVGRGPWILCLLTAALVAAGTPAQAQPEEDFRSRATMRAGPLYLKPGFRLERLGWESNVFSRPDAKPDFVVSGRRRWTPGCRSRAAVCLDHAARRG